MESAHKPALRVVPRAKRSPAEIAQRHHRAAIKAAATAILEITGPYQAHSVRGCRLACLRSLADALDMRQDRLAALICELEPSLRADLFARR